MTRAQIVERAIAFITKAKARHSIRLGLEVGEYLFVHLYAGDETYLFTKRGKKDNSLRDIAAATGLTHGTLSNWIKASIVARRLRALGIAPELSLTKLEALYPFDDKDTLLALIEWTRPMVVSDTERFIRDLAAHLEAGGTLESFDEATREDPRREPRKRRRYRTTRHLIVPRLINLLTDWATHSRLTAPQRRTLVARLRAIRARLA
jgi:hypothetical protein